MLKYAVQQNLNVYTFEFAISLEDLEVFVHGVSRCWLLGSMLLVLLRDLSPVLAADFLH